MTVTFNGVAHGSNTATLDVTHNDDGTVSLSSVTLVNGSLVVKSTTRLLPDDVKSLVGALT